jgi:hypothetical protein
MLGNHNLYASGMTQHFCRFGRTEGVHSGSRRSRRTSFRQANMGVNIDKACILGRSPSANQSWTSCACCSAVYEFQPAGGEVIRPPPVDGLVPVEFSLLLEGRRMQDNLCQSNFYGDGVFSSLAERCRRTAMEEVTRGNHDMNFREFVSGRWVQQYQYKSFLFSEP